jgi:hypothetical protein
MEIQGSILTNKAIVLVMLYKICQMIFWYDAVLFA